MFQSSSPARDLLDTVTRRLTYVGELLAKGLDDYFPAPTAAPDQIRRKNTAVALMRQYVTTVRELLDNHGAAMPECIPFVLMDLDVTVEDAESGDTETFVVVGPDQSDAICGRISCLSPLGKALLLKRPGDSVIYDAPGGQYNYRITSIGREQ